jgi:hypothetical protein
MAISSESRYQEADRVFTTTHTYSERRQIDLNDAGEPLLTVRDTLYRTLVSSTADTDVPDEILAREGDSLQLLATTLLGDPGRWWELADANPQVRYPFDLKMGDILVVPE